MKIVLISDVHANLEALVTVKKSIRNEGADSILFVGDIVGYGANPNECIEILQDLTDKAVAGNHDWAAIGKNSTEYFNPAAKEAIEWTHDQLTEASKAFLNTLPLRGELQQCLYVHATPENPQDWDYISTTWEAHASFQAFSQQVCFIGHSHQPAIFIKPAEGDTLLEQSTHIMLKQHNRYLINIGSVGQPRDGTPLAGYGIYDTKKNEYRLIRVQYDINTAQQKIIDAGLDPFLAQRLSIGM